jgi:ATP-dependent DNA helicase RecQ
MAKRCPRNVNEFAEVNGVGASKLKDFAERFLHAIKAHQDSEREITAAAERRT